MQTDILLKQVISSLDELKTSIAKFEKHPSPSTDYTEQLHQSLVNANKLVSAYLVMKHQKDVAPDLDLHLKVMAVTDAAKTVEQMPVAEPQPELKAEPEPERKPEPVKEPEPEVIKPVIQQAAAPEVAPVQPATKINISINDKFRFINELFKGNVNEYNIAVEQINTLKNNDEGVVYLKGLKSIYGWDDEHEMVKKLHLLTQKRFL